LRFVVELQASTNRPVRMHTIKRKDLNIWFPYLWDGRARR
jgi:hypothetical protein